jgi:uracil-DNA glycosylase
LSERGKLQLRALAQVEREWRDCDKCELAATRRKVVFWRGNPNAKLILIGEAPGENEELSGRPFTGPAGRLLDAALVSAGLDPAEDVWIANVIGCRPPGNRRPTPDEIRGCRSRLYQMQDAVTGRAVLLLGVTAGSLAGVHAVKNWRGEELEVTFRDESPSGLVELPGFITPHPSYVLRSGGKGSQAYKDLVLDIENAFRRANQ